MVVVESMAAARRAKVAAALGVVVWWWWWWAVAVVGCGAQPVVVGSYGQPRLWLKPYDWSYLRG